jgi:hypothetical protein
VLRPLARGDLIVQGLPRGGDLIDARAIIVVVVDEDDRHLAIADKAATVGVWRAGGRQWGIDGLASREDSVPSQDNEPANMETGTGTSNR